MRECLTRLCDTADSLEGVPVETAPDRKTGQEGERPSSVWKLPPDVVYQERETTSPGRKLLQPGTGASTLTTEASLPVFALWVVDGWRASLPSEIIYPPIIHHCGL